MKGTLSEVTYTVELAPGEKLTLPASLLETVGPGRWIVTVRSDSDPAIRRHDAFLRGYAAGDEGIYDDISR